MTVTLGLAGDTMLGRSVAERLSSGTSPEDLVSPDLLAVTREADLFVLNLECCISERGEPWPAPGKPFFFRAPPAAVEALVHLGVDCVTLANNHALDYGETALLDTLQHLSSANIACVGAGPDVSAARAPALVGSDDLRLAVLGVTDHPQDFAATPTRAGVAFADLRRGVPDWLPGAIGDAAGGADALLVTPHWGPNMSADPVRHVRSAARAFVAAGATLVAGHSAHVFQGVDGRVLFDLGDFIDDYAVDPVVRNDLGLLYLITLDRAGPLRIEAVPLALDNCFTRIANDEEAAWIGRRLRQACAAFGTDVADEAGRFVITQRS